MLSTALAIQQATQEAIHDETVMDIAAHIYHSKDSLSSDDFVKALFMYSAHLSALTATLVTHVCLTENQMEEMITSLKEFDNLEKEINNGN